MRRNMKVSGHLRPVTPPPRSDSQRAVISLVIERSCLEEFRMRGACRSQQTANSSNQHQHHPASTCSRLRGIAPMQGLATGSPCSRGQSRQRGSPPTRPSALASPAHCACTARLLAPQEERNKKAVAHARLQGTAAGGGGGGRGGRTALDLRTLARDFLFRELRILALEPVNRHKISLKGHFVDCTGAKESTRERTSSGSAQYFSRG